MAAAAEVGCDLKTLCLIPLLIAPALRAETFYVTVAGLGGEAEYEQRFTGWAKDIDKILKAAEPNAKVETLFGVGATKATSNRQIEARSRKRPSPTIRWS